MRYVVFPLKIKEQELKNILFLITINYKFFVIFAKHTDFLTILTDTTAGERSFNRIRKTKTYNSLDMSDK